MGKRNSPRKVVIRLISREPEDRLALLRAIEKAFQPDDVEIAVTSTPPNDAIPNEQLEAKATEQCSKILDEKEHTARASEAKPRKLDEVENKRGRLKTWIAKNAVIGFRIVAKVLPIAKKIKQLLE